MTKIEINLFDRLNRSTHDHFQSKDSNKNLRLTYEPKLVMKQKRSKSNTVSRSSKHPGRREEGRKEDIGVSMFSNQSNFVQYTDQLQ